MRTLTIVIALLLAAPAMAQGKPKAAAVEPDTCAPIGRTADGRFVYSLKCETLPAPPPAPRAAAGGTAAAEPAAAATEEEDKGGLFRNPFPSLIRPSSSERIPGVGPPPSGR